MRRAFVLAVVALSSALMIPGAGAQTPEDVANRISGEVMSPYCPGVTLHECPSDAATEKRDEIESWVRAGWSEDRIMAQLEEDFGSNIRANPTGARGFWAWVIPALMLAAGVAVATKLSRSWAGGRRSVDEGTPVAPADHARVERELQVLREEAGG